MKTTTFTADDGREFLVTEYATGELTLAERPNTWSTWGPPIRGVAEEYNYRTERRVEDVLTEGWRGL